MGIMIFVIIGFSLAAGFAAQRLVPGPDPAGIVGTILIGVAGGLVGGLLGSLVAGVSVTAFDGRILLMAIVGTMVALFGYRTYAMRALT
jgi:uncharacterized membrane protein YeaQ/YmgE (transglycosylase-associated protein family)